MSSFIHLHVHSEYSLLDGACRIHDLPRVAKELGQTAIAITDHGVMYGAVEFYKACRKENIKPIIGCEVYVAPNSRWDKNQLKDRNYYHLVLLCENNTGYKNLCKLVSLSYAEGFYMKPRVDRELLETYHEGLIALSACLAGEIPQKLLAGQYEEAKSTALSLSQIFGPDHFYLELQNHGQENERIVNEEITALSSDTSIPLVCTNDAHYCHKEDAESHRILLDIQLNKTVKDGIPLGFSNDEFYIKSEAEMRRLFPGQKDALDNTAAIAERCNVTFDFSHIHLPKFIPDDGSTPYECLKRLTCEGFRSKIDNGEIVFTDYSKETYEKRIEYELSTIENMGYSQYYLIVRDFVVHSKNDGIPVGPGRGSGAGSLVAYLIGITQVDSIRYQLLFERFLNPERVSMPDFDIDFSDVRREDAIKYVQAKYGADHTSQIVTFGTLGVKAVLRDVARVLEMSYEQGDDVVRMIPSDFQGTLSEALETCTELKTAYQSDSRIKKLLDLSLKLEGMPRHSSIHAAGVVITDAPVDEYVPVSVVNGMTVTQYDMNTIGELGLLKFDFLGLKYLTILHNAESLVKQKEPDFDLSKVSLEEPKVYEMLSQGSTDGVFQLESQGIRNLLMQLKPDHFDDIIAVLSLYRPGPMDSIPNYVSCRHGLKKPVYVSPLLAPILDSTYGCIIYQEQVMQIFVALAGYSMGRADIVRKAIAKKKMEVLLEERPLFVQNSKSNGVSETDANRLFDDIVSFGRYAFNKCHATPYSMLTYQTAYLKCFYPLEFYSALLSSVLSNSEKIAQYIQKCEEAHINILPPDINHSDAWFHPEENSIRFSLLALKGIGSSFVDSLVKDREQNGPYASLEDFMARVDTRYFNKKEFEILIKAGVFDEFGIKRSQLLYSYESILNSKATTQRSMVDGQLDLFSTVSDADSTDLPGFVFPTVPELSLKEKMKFEREVSGLFLTAHLLDDYSEHIQLIHPTPLSAFSTEPEEGETVTYSVHTSFRDRQPVVVCGLLVSRENRQTKKGEAMATVVLEDQTSSVDVVVFPKTLAEYGYLLRVDNLVMIHGLVSLREEKKIQIIAQKVLPLYENGKIPNDIRMTLSPHADKASEKSGKATPAKSLRLFIRVPSCDSPEYKKALGLLEVFSGTTPVLFYDNSLGKYFSPGNIQASNSDFLLRELREIVGADSVVLK